MTTLIAILAVLLGSISTWYAAYWIKSVDNVTTTSRHLSGALWAAPVAGLLTWIVAPADAGSPPGWGWVIFGLLISLCIFAFAKAIPESVKEVLQKQNAKSTIEPKHVTPRPVSSRAIRSGWSMGEIAFTYEDSAGDITSRTVTVHSVTSTYIKGECHDRKAERTFRVDRIVGDIVDCESGELMSPMKWARQNK